MILPIMLLIILAINKGYLMEVYELSTPFGVLNESHDTNLTHIYSGVKQNVRLLFAQN